MSFLNSVLSSINTGKAPITVPQVRRSKPEEPPADKAPPSANAKRKASGELSGPSDKLSRTSTLLKASTGASAKDGSTSSKPRPTAAGSSTTGSAQRPLPAAAAAGASKAAPKKGSFQEIMARANAAAQVGQITHKSKPKELLSTKKELAIQKEMAKQSKKGGPGVGQKGAFGRKVNGPQLEKAAATSRGAEKKEKTDKGSKPGGYQGTIKQRPQSAYQGTAKPKPATPGYTGTAKPNDDMRRKREYDSEPDRGHSTAAARHKRYHSDAENGSEDEEDDGYTYASSDYSDMDAGFDDVDEEEAAADRQAKKEDVWEQRRLEELARQKALRKKRAESELGRERNLRR